MFNKSIVSSTWICAFPLPIIVKEKCKNQNTSTTEAKQKKEKTARKHHTRTADELT
jgi:hypothetical protein